MDKEIFEQFMQDSENAKKIDAIRKDAFELHDVDCNQKYGDGLPYSHHLNMVFEIAVKNLHKVCAYEYHIIPILFGACFHDSIEDARLTYNDVLSIAGKYMTRYQALIAAEIVYALTNEKGRNRKERASEKYYDGIRNTRYAPFVKWCDRYANVQFSIGMDSRMIKVYKKEMTEFVVLLGGDRYLTHELCDDILNLIEKH